MNIALDYDGTFTRDPGMWEKFIGIAKSAGHTVVICTMRFPNTQESIDGIKSLGVDVVYTSRHSKADHMQSIGVPVDIWIDDMPGWIFADSIG